jgi:hypothetical protein
MHNCERRITLKTLLLAALLALPTLAGSTHADELPDEMLGRWCHVDTQWDSAVFGMFASSHCKDGTGVNLTKTTESYFGPEPQNGYPNATCTIDRITKLEDEHYLVESTCKEILGPDRMHPNRGQPYSNDQILYVDTCGRLQSKDPDYCHPHCLDEPGSTFQSEPPAEVCRVS